MHSPHSVQVNILRLRVRGLRRIGQDVVAGVVAVGAVGARGGCRSRPPWPGRWPSRPGSGTGRRRSRSGRTGGGRAGTRSNRASGGHGQEDALVAGQGAVEQVVVDLEGRQQVGQQGQGPEKGETERPRARVGASTRRRPRMASGGRRGWSRRAAPWRSHRLGLAAGAPHQAVDQLRPPRSGGRASRSRAGPSARRPRCTGPPPPNSGRKPRSNRLSTASPLPPRPAQEVVDAQGPGLAEQDDSGPG